MSCVKFDISDYFVLPDVRYKRMHSKVLNYGINILIWIIANIVILQCKKCIIAAPTPAFMEHNEWYRDRSRDWSHTFHLRLALNTAKLHNLGSDHFIFLKHKSVLKTSWGPERLLQYKPSRWHYSTKACKAFFNRQKSPFDGFVLKNTNAAECENDTIDPQSQQSSVYIMERIALNFSLGGVNMTEV